jgi:GT2 family glycosyltransferase
MLPDSLRSLRRATYDSLEILVVDNAPNDEATRKIVAAMAAEDPRVRYTCEPRPGKSLALNHGLAQAKFEVVAITDDDALADPGWLSAIAAAFDADPHTVCVTGMVASSTLNTEAERYFDARYPWGEGFQFRRYDLAAHRHPSRFYPFTAGVFGTGANCAFRRHAVAEIGGFDPLLGAGGPQRGGADLDIFVRLILAGGRITYLPSALVWHRHRADARALAEQMYTYGHGLGAYLAKHLPNRELRDALLSHGLRHAAMALGRQRVAAQSGQLGAAAAKRLALYEAWGIMPGAVRYWLAARRKSESAAGMR